MAYCGLGVRETGGKGGETVKGWKARCGRAVAACAFIGSG